MSTLAGVALDLDLDPRTRRALPPGRRRPTGNGTRGRDEAADAPVDLDAERARRAARPDDGPAVEGRGGRRDAARCGRVPANGRGVGGHDAVRSGRGPADGGGVGGRDAVRSGRVPVVEGPVRGRGVGRAGVGPEASVLADRPRRAVRLTRRGRVLVLGLLVVLLTAGTVGLGAARALSASTEPPQRQVEVIVAEGDTLWSIAAAVAPRSDKAETVARIREANQLGGSHIEPGQQLVVPVAR